MADNKNPILIRRISHLTDARYFAAMGVEWMSIHLTADPASFAFWHAIREWVAGVNLAAEPDSHDEDVLARVVIDAQPDGIIIPKKSSILLQEGIKIFFASAPGEECIIPESGSLIWPYPDPGAWKKIAAFNTSDQLFLEADWNINMLEEVLATGYDGGFCFHGSTEEEKGMVDYSLMDDMLNLLSSN